MKQALAGIKLSPLDFKFFFFSWWENPGYRLDVGRKVFDERHKEYFKQLKEKHEIDLDVGQKMWYVQKHAINGDNMLAEYPSLPEEAFHSSIKGAYYASEMVRVYEDNRIMNIAVDPTIPVDTWWDLGMNDKNTIVFTQRYGNEIRVVDYYENSGEGLGHYVNKLKDKKYHYGVHTFPHDVKVRELSTGISRQQTLMDLRLQPIRVIERTKNVVDDIEAVRRLFPRFYFDEGRCGKLIEALENYRREWNEKTGEFGNNPRHDKHSHAADAMRTLARGWTNQGLNTFGKKEELVTSDLF
jgi:hypothetical protein